MEALLNKLFIESFSFLNQENLSIEDSLKIADILLLNIEVDCNNAEEYNSYLDNFKVVNNLLHLYFKDKCEGEEFKVFDNNNIEKCKWLEVIPKRKQALDNLKKKRLAFYKRVEGNLVDLGDKWKLDKKAA